MRGRLLLTACTLTAFLLSPAVADAQYRNKKSNRATANGLASLSALSGSAKGADIAKLQGLMARAKAAQNGQGSLGGGDTQMALRLAGQLGLTPEQLAARIHRSPAGQTKLKGLSQQQLAAHIRALAKKHGAHFDSPAGKKKAAQIRASKIKSAQLKAAQAKAAKKRAALKKAR